MTRTVQKRTLRTRARLLSVSRSIVDEVGYEALRVEEVVRRAEVAKGTFFAHFRDKDALMDILMGARIDALLDGVADLPPAGGVDEVVDRLHPVHEFMSSERYVFDVILRYSGAAAVSEIGPIAQTFERYVTVVAGWLVAPCFRQDAGVDLLAEGVQAFAVQSMALRFCALHRSTSYRDRLATYLSAWLLPPGKAGLSAASTVG